MYRCNGLCKQTGRPTTLPPFRPPTCSTLFSSSVITNPLQQQKEEYAENIINESIMLKRANT